MAKHDAVFYEQSWLIYCTVTDVCYSVNWIPLTSGLIRRDQEILLVMDKVMFCYRLCYTANIDPKLSNCCLEYAYNDINITKLGILLLYIFSHRAFMTGYCWSTRYLSNFNKRRADHNEERRIIFMPSELKHYHSNTFNKIYHNIIVISTLTDRIKHILFKHETIAGRIPYNKILRSCHFYFWRKWITAKSFSNTRIPTKCAFTKQKLPL
jgi:hypothetical protein